MARPEPLLTRYDLSLTLLEQEKRIKQTIEGIDANTLLNSSQDDLCEGLEQQFRFDVPLLKEDAIQVDQGETTVDVSGDPSRIIFDRSRPFYMKGTEITFFVPYEGDGHLFFFRPNRYSMSGVRAEVGEGELAFSYTRLDHDARAAEREFQNDLTFVRNHLEIQREQVKQHNETLRSRIQSQVAERRDRLLSSQGAVAALGYPMRRRADAPATYVAPTVRRKPAIAKGSAPGKPFKPEPALDMAEYEHILRIISSMVQSNEDVCFPLEVEGLARRLSFVVTVELNEEVLPEVLFSHPFECLGTSLYHMVNGLVDLFDFKNPENNDWVAVNQFTVIEGRSNRRRVQRAPMILPSPSPAPTAR